jgi:hypothetical protein
MLTIRPTKMLARRLRIELPPAPPVITNYVADWCVHEFRVSRHRFLIFCNTAALYPVVMAARGVTDGPSLVARLAGGLKLCMEGTALDSHFQRWIAPELAAVQWAPVPGKSILGSMNDMISMAKYSLAHRNESPVDLSRWLAKSPMSALGMNSPDRVFPKLTG